MPAYKPEECDLLLIEALNRGDVDTVVALYEPTARYVLESGQVIMGHAAVREVMQGFVAAKAQIIAEKVTATQSEDATVAVTSITGHIRYTTPEGKQVTMRGQSMEVVRRQPDGTWRFIIDNPNEANWREVPEGQV